MTLAVLSAAIALAVVEAWLGLRARRHSRRTTGGDVLRREWRRAWMLAIRGLVLAGLAAAAALGGAEALAEWTGAWAAVPAALAVRAALDTAFAAWGRCLGGPWRPRALLAEQGRRLAGELAPALPLGMLAGAMAESAWSWPAAWACLAALLVWREVVPPAGRRLSPAPFIAAVPVWISDEGGRTGQLNARAEGIGPWRRIVVTDRLAETLPRHETEAVLAHEAGHLAGRHRERYLAWRLGMAAILLGLAAALTAPSPAVLVLLVLAAPALALPVRPLETLMIRRWEEQADRFAAARVGAAPFADALERLFGANAQAPEPDPLWAAFHHPHPAPRRRLARLRPPPLVPRSNG